MKRNTLNKNPLISVVLLFSALAVASCTGSSNEGSPTAPSVEPATGDAKPLPIDVSTRGNIIKEVGELGGSYLEEGSDEWAFSFTVTDIEIDPVCTSDYIYPAENGHMVAVTIEAITAPEPEFSKSGLSGVSFSPAYWKAIAANGTTVNSVSSAAADNCFPRAESIPDLGAGERVVGKVVLDVPDVTGTLVFTNGAVTGWEWEYGAK